ncbi:head maturation protease, ClpP-related [Streptococcus suis]|uniref:Clp protease ClpP n=1 Tax=Streptococcus suis TaxID=1307 RepID=A0A9X4MQS0_STRSU|nr:head maturation protease, ClpP-related [Streptococcus suis]MDG4515624.1 Clp protease ClpP [Streptococcus suis]MDG4521923.1 Clp protease ClpP [Streptococcus suis]
MKRSNSSEIVYGFLALRKAMKISTKKEVAPKSSNVIKFAKKSLDLSKFKNSIQSETRPGKLYFTLEGAILDQENCICVRNLKKEIEKHQALTEIEITLTTYGGDLFEGIALKNYLKKRPESITILVKDIVASAGSVMAMGADTIKMYSDSELMIHNPWTFTSGNAVQLRKVAGDLEKAQVSIEEAYLTRFSATRNKLKTLLDEETWLSPSQAIQYNLADQEIKI